jgi:hypothetical protein
MAVLGDCSERVSRGRNSRLKREPVPKALQLLDVYLNLADIPKWFAWPNSSTEVIGKDWMAQVLDFVEDWAGLFGRGVFAMDLDDSHHIAAARAALPKICSQLNNCDPR